MDNFTRFFGLPVVKRTAAWLRHCYAFIPFYFCIGAVFDGGIDSAIHSKNNLIIIPMMYAFFADDLFLHNVRSSRIGFALRWLPILFTMIYFKFGQGYKNDFDKLMPAASIVAGYLLVLANQVSIEKRNA